MSNDVPVCGSSHFEGNFCILPKGHKGDHNFHDPSTGETDSEHVFESGAKRSKLMPYYTAIPATSLRRVALRATGAPKGASPLIVDGFKYEGGSDGYGYGNWQRGLTLEDTLNHIYDHLGKWYDRISNSNEKSYGVPVDDDLSAIAWGILMPLMTFERQYIEQLRWRKTFINSGDGPNGLDPKDVDNALAGVCKASHEPVLLQPLAPKKATIDILYGTAQIRKDVFAKAVEGLPLSAAAPSVETSGRDKIEEAGEVKPPSLCRQVFYIGIGSYYCHLPKGHLSPHGCIVYEQQK